MSDDFDKLRPPGDEDDSDDESLDWQKDKGKKSGESASGENLGFTGELSWRKDIEDAFEEQMDSLDDDALDWQQGQKPQGGSSSEGGLGFTGQLDWKKVQPSGDTAGDSDESLDWLGAMDEGETPAGVDDSFEQAPVSETGEAEPYDDPLSWMDQYGDDLVADEPAAESSFFDDEDDELFARPADQIDQPAEQDDPLSWLNQYSAGDAPPAEAAPTGGAALPSWLDEPEAEAPAEPGDADLPPWLSQAAPAEKPITEGGKLSADWLAGAEEAPETASSEISFDEWQRIQDEMTRPRDVDEEMPDLFSELGSAPPVGADDLPQTDTGQLPSWVLGMDDLDESAAPDWLSESQPTPASPGPAPVSDDIFGELGLPSPETGYDFLDQPTEEEDLLTGLNLGGASDTPDWFAGLEQPAASKESPDWLSELGDLSEAPGAPTINVGAGAVPAEDDFLAELGGAGRRPAAEIDPMDTSGLQDIDSLLASYEVATNLPTTDDLIDQSAEVDRLLSQDDLEQISARRGAEARPSSGITGLSPDAPDWLAELGANVDEVSAAAIVRKQTQKERPLDELSDRLQALHERGLDMPAVDDAKPSEILRTLLPGVTEVLPAAPMQPGQGGLIGDLVLTDAQREKINLLKTLVGTDEDERRPAGRPSAIDLTLATPNLADLGVDEEPELAAAQPQVVPVARRTRRRPKFDRILIGLFLTAAVILPFLVNTVWIGDLPPAQFAAGSRGQAVFDRIEALQQGDLALIAAEYGPTGAGELDTALDALLRHVLLRGARPVIVSGNPVGLLHAGNVLERVAGDASFLGLIDRPTLQANQDYYVLRYLAASTIGLRAFGEDLPRMLPVDANGQPTNLEATSVNDFALIAVVAESAEEIRGWGEQIAPLVGEPLVAITGQSAAPLSEPYVLAGSPEQLTGLGGLLVGYRDAYTYRTMVDRLASGGGIFVLPSTMPTTETPIAPTPTVEGGAVAEAMEEAATSEAEASPTPEGAQPTNTLPPTATSQPSNTPTPTRTPSNTPTATFTPSATATFEPALEVRGVIDSDQAVNVREGPGRTFAPISSLTPGTIVQITGRDGAGEWLKVLLDDGREGWVSASLVAVEEPPQATDETGFNIDLDSQVAGLISDVAFYAPPAQADTPAPETTADATPEVTVEATVAPTIVTPTPVVAAIPATTPYRDERWYGMTLGLVAIILVITIGMIANIVRGLFRRGK